LQDLPFWLKKIENKIMLVEEKSMKGIPAKPVGN